MMPDFPNIRIVRRRSGLPPELYGQWYVKIDGTDSKMPYIRKQFEEILSEEPGMGWKLETRGTESDWHEVKHGV